MTSISFESRSQGTETPMQYLTMGDSSGSFQEGGECVIDLLSRNLGQTLVSLTLTRIDLRLLQGAVGSGDLADFQTW